MKTKINLPITLFLISFFLISFVSCTKEYRTDEYTYITSGTQSAQKGFLVTKDRWQWNENNRRYECFFNDFRELTTLIYDEGTIVGSVYVNPKTDREWMEILPYQAAYEVLDEAEDPVKFTVNISCAFRPGSVGFFIQTSDRYRDDVVLYDYEFKISMFWEEKK